MFEWVYVCVCVCVGGGWWMGRPSRGLKSIIRKTVSVQPNLMKFTFNMAYTHAMITKYSTLYEREKKSLAFKDRK